MARAVSDASERKSATNQGHKSIELPSEMAAVLGFKNIQQTDIDKFYYPNALGEPLEAMHGELQTELIRLLRNTNNLVVDPKPSATNQIIEPTTGKPIPPQA